MFKRLERKWNDHTPEYLHNGTKANIKWQLKLTVVFVLVMLAYEEAKSRLEQKRLHRNDPKN